MRQRLLGSDLTPSATLAGQGAFQGSDSRGSDSQGTDFRGTASQGTDSRGTALRGTACRGSSFHPSSPAPHTPAATTPPTPTSIPEAAGSWRTWDSRYCLLWESYFVVHALNRLGAT